MSKVDIISYIHIFVLTGSFMWLTKNGRSVIYFILIGLFLHLVSTEYLKYLSKRTLLDIIDRNNLLPEQCVLCTKRDYGETVKENK